MITSSASIREASSRTELSVMSPAGTITHAARGLSNMATNSSMEEAPFAPSRASALTASGLTSNTTHSCPSRISRRTRFAPIRPSPTIPSCIAAVPFVRVRSVTVPDSK